MAANANRYGMVASIFSKDAAFVFQAAEKLECGIVHINEATIGAEVHVPFGGIKDTRVGDREIGSTAKDFYTELKAIYVITLGRAKLLQLLERSGQRISDLMLRLA